MEKSMNDTLKPMKEDKHGSQDLMELEPWDIAPLLICQRDGKLVDVEHATDAEFDTWINGHRVPVINGQWGGGWSFSDRCGVINHVRKRGIELKFLDTKSSGPELSRIVLAPAIQPKSTV